MKRLSAKKILKKLISCFYFESTNLEIFLTKIDDFLGCFLFLDGFFKKN